MTRTRTFFIVDDDQDDIDLFKEAAAKVDPDVQCFSFVDGNEALKSLSDTLVLPDAIFLDLNMPRMNGRQCLTEIRKMEELSGVPVVIYSTSSYEKDIQETKELGASHFFSKPSSFNELCNILSDILSGEVNSSR